MSLLELEEENKNSGSMLHSISKSRPRSGSRSRPMKADRKSKSRSMSLEMISSDSSPGDRFRERKRIKRSKNGDQNQNKGHQSRQRRITGNPRSRSHSRSRNNPAESEQKPKSRSRSRSRRSDNERSLGGGLRENRSSRQDRSRGQNQDKNHQSRRRRSNSSCSSSQSSNSCSPNRMIDSDLPKHVESRVFVANFVSKDVTRRQLKTLFSNYGNVVDVKCHPHNFGFVQFLKAEHAKRAIEEANGIMMSGMKIVVKKALGPLDRAGRASSRGGEAIRSGADGEWLPPNESVRDPFERDPYMHDRGRPSYSRPLPEHVPYVEPYKDPYVPSAPQPPSECVILYINSQLQNYAERIVRMVKGQSVIATSAMIPEGYSALQMIDDLSEKGALFAMFINTQNETHQSLSLNILHGPTHLEHRNMPLDDAITLIGDSFEEYVEELRAKANASHNKPEVAASPDLASDTHNPSITLSSEIQNLLNKLAGRQALTIQELTTVILYLKDRREKLLETENGHIAIPDSSGVPRRPAEDRGYPDRRSPERLPELGYENISPLRNMETGYAHRDERGTTDGGYNDQDQDRLSAGDRYKAQQTTNTSTPVHEDHTKQIVSISQGGNQNLSSQLTSAASVDAPQAPTPALIPPLLAPSNANLINLANPNVQKALDNLIQSGPDLLKNIAPNNSLPSTSLTSVSGSVSASENLASNNNGYSQTLVQNQVQLGQQMMANMGMLQGGSQNLRPEMHLVHLWQQMGLVNLIQPPGFCDSSVFNAPVQSFSKGRLQEKKSGR